MVAASLMAAAPANADATLIVTSPLDGATVSTPTPVFAGTGTPRELVSVSYVGQQGDTYNAGAVEVDQDGRWETVTSFPRAIFGATEIAVKVVSTDGDDVETGAVPLTVRFTEPPVVSLPIALTSPTAGDVFDADGPVTFAGTGVAGYAIQVLYIADNGDLALAGSAPVESDGTFTVSGLFPLRPLDSSSVETITRQVDAEQDPVSDDIVRTVDFTAPPVPAAPLTVTSPEDGEIVETPTPAFTGTGEQGDTVQLVYVDRRGESSLAGQTVIDDDGTWTVPATDFALADFDQTRIDVTVGALTPSGDPRPGAFVVSIEFADPPVPAAPFAVTSPVDGATIPDNLSVVTFTGTGVAGATVVILHADVAETLSEAGHGVVGPDGSFSIPGTFRDLPDTPGPLLILAQQVDAAGIQISPNIQFHLTFAQIVPVPEFLVESPANGSTVDSAAPTYTGTGVPGDAVTVYFPGQNGREYTAGSALVTASGAWSISDTDFRSAVPGQTEITTTVEATTPSGEPEPRGSVEITLVFSTAPGVQTLETPTLAQPAVSGSTVSFAGAGEPGAIVEVAVATPSVLASRARVVAAAPAVLRTTVGTSGTWTVSGEFGAGRYTASATQLTGNGDDRSAPSEPVTFVVAAVIPTPSPSDSGSSSTQSAGSARALAATGSDPTSLAALSGLLILVGAAGVIVRRRRMTVRR